MVGIRISIVYGIYFGIQLRIYHSGFLLDLLLWFSSCHVRNQV